MTAFELDHITIIAPDLIQGAAHVERLLGIQPSPGGKHPLMGTHNLLMSLGPDLFLEIIAIDPQAPPPARPRWFNLDHPPAAPVLNTWVLRTQDIDAAVAGPFPDAGVPTALSRGSLNWQMSIADTGRMPLNGASPTLIQWPEAPPVAASLPDPGCRLRSFCIRHPEAEQLRATLAANIQDDRIVVEQAALMQLEALIETPDGPRRLI